MEFASQHVASRPVRKLASAKPLRADSLRFAIGLSRSVVTHGYCVRHRHPREQLVEVVRRFDLVRQIRPFARCMRCNGVLATLPPEAARPRLPARVRAPYTEYPWCRTCGRVPWHV